MQGEFYVYCRNLGRLYARFLVRINRLLLLQARTGKGTIRIFWYFLLYSFFGFLLEVAFARVTRSPKRDRKCLLFLPLCPVYGLGALGILAAGEVWGNDPLILALAGAGAATAAEYLMGVFYQRVLGVEFWNYSELPLNLGGKVCLIFSATWGLLALVLVYLVHPHVAVLVSHIPGWLTPAAAILLLTDSAVSLWLLKTTGSTDSLKWYETFLPVR